MKVQLTVKLTKKEIEILDRQDPESRDDGGFQSFLVNLQKRLDRENRTIGLTEEDLKKIPRYAFEYGQGGWEDRLRRIFGRSLGPALDRRIRFELSDPPERVEEGTQFSEGKIVFQEMAGPHHWREKEKEYEKQLAEAAEKHGCELKIKSVDRGSVAVYIAIYAAAEFLRKYPNVREGFLKLLGDLGRAAHWIQEEVRKRVRRRDRSGDREGPEIGD